MVIDHDFELVPPPEGADASLPASVPPRVVIQYRGRLWTIVLIPAVAALASAVTFVAVRPRDVLHPAPAPLRPAPAPVAPPAESLVLRVAPLPELPQEVPPETIERADPETVEPAVPEPPVAQPVVAAVTEAPKSTDAEEATRQALASISAEAERAGQARAEMERLRAAVPAIEAQAREQARQAVDAQRWTFHRDLRKLLQEQGNGAAQAIWDLVLLSGSMEDADALRVTNQAVRTELERTRHRLDRDGRIALFRRRGLPEPLILAILFHEQQRMMPSRKGPRNRNEAILRAAKQLLAVPPRRVAPAAGKGPIAENRPRIPGPR